MGLDESTISRVMWFDLPAGVQEPLVIMVVPQMLYPRLAFALDRSRQKLP